jgi:hypothetical protein
MMSEYDGVTLRSVKWFDLVPWLSILRSFRLATSLRLLVLGALGIVLTLAGWWLLTWMFLGDPQEHVWWESEFARSASPWKSIDEAVGNAPQLPGQPEQGTPPSGTPRVPVAEGVDSGAEAANNPATWSPFDPFLSTWALLSRPVWKLFHDSPTSVRNVACLVLSLLWSLAVWGFCGGAISRIAAVQLASDERVGWGSALRYARGKWLSYFAAPLFPLLGILLIVVPLALVGLLLRAGWLLFLLGVLFWPLVLVGGFVMALLLLGLVFGWPLMWATISAEGTDTFDALSRSYAYTFQRPLRYLFYALVAAVLGWLGWLVVSNFAAGIIWLGLWATSWGSGADRWQQIVGLKDVTGWGGPTGAALVHFWSGCVKCLALGYVYAYFWTASTAIYFQLRRDVDATELDEVFLEEDESEQSYGLPPLDAGAPPPIEKPQPMPEPAAQPVASAGPSQ